MSRPTKAIIAVAGYGTRWLPVTKAVEKCMIPVGNRPIVDYAVDACVAAGITDICFVVGEQSQQIRTYYGHNQRLEDHLLSRQNLEAIDTIGSLAIKARFHFVEQDSKQPYGSSVPLWLARNYLKPEESFLYMYGDNLHYDPAGGSAVAELLDRAEQAAASDAMLAVEVPHTEVYKYGVVDVEARDGAEYYKRIVEKPRPEAAPTNLNNAGCFLLRREVLPFVQQSMERPDPASGEHYLIDALNWYHEAGNDLLVVRSPYEYLDCGTVPGWVAANNRILAG